MLYQWLWSAYSVINGASRSNSWSVSERVFWGVELFLALFQRRWLSLHLSSEVTLSLQLPHCSPKALTLLLLESPLPLPSLKCTFGGTSLDPKRLEEGEAPPKKYPKYSPLKCGFLYTPVYIIGCLGKCEESHWDVLNSPQSRMCSKYGAWELWTDAISVYLYASLQWQRLCWMRRNIFGVSSWSHHFVLGVCSCCVPRKGRAAPHPAQRWGHSVITGWGLTGWGSGLWQKIWESSRTVGWM